MLFALPLFLAISWWAGRDEPPLTGADLRLLTGLGFSGYYLASFLDFSMTLEGCCGLSTARSASSPMPWAAVTSCIRCRRRLVAVLSRAKAVVAACTVKATEVWATKALVLLWFVLVRLITCACVMLILSGSTCKEQAAI